MKHAPDFQTFVCDFGPGTRCVLLVPVGLLTATPAASVLPLPPPMVQGRLGPEHFPRYRDWLAETWQTIADASHKALSGAIPKPGGGLLGIVCEPGQRPEFFHVPTP